MYETYTFLGDFELALESYILSNQAEDELFLKRNQNYITMLETTAKYERTLNQIDLPVRNNEMKKMAIRYPGEVGYALFAGLKRKVYPKTGHYGKLMNNTIGYTVNIKHIVSVINIGNAEVDFKN